MSYSKGTWLVGHKHGRKDVQIPIYPYSPTLAMLTIAEVTVSEANAQHIVALHNALEPGGCIALLLEEVDAAERVLTTLSAEWAHRVTWNLNAARKAVQALTEGQA